MNVVESFIANYQREHDFYDRLAYLCESQCRELCKSVGINAIISHRAKMPDKLYKKVLRKQSEKNTLYASENEIRHDIIDLAGVRIALYFPDDQERIERLITQNFLIMGDRKVFPQKNTGVKNGKYTNRFPGYKALHYRVQLREPKDAEDKRYVGETIEIQIASVFMHAWSEVEHDLAYKNSKNDQLSDAEYQILDQLNGLAHSGELALTQLRQAGFNRTNFRNHYELAAFLLNEISTRDPQEEPAEMGAVDILFEFLKSIELTSVSKLREYTNRIKLNNNHRPIAGNLASEILLGHPEWEDLYGRAHFRVANHHPVHYYLEQGDFDLKNLPTGCLIKGSAEQLYWYSRNGKRYPVPNKETFETWYPTNEAKPYVKQIPDGVLIKIMIGGNVTYKPGTRLVKIRTDPKVYAISHGGVARWVSNEHVAVQIFGQDWRERLVDIIYDGFFVNYTLGSNIASVRDYDPEYEQSNATTIDADIN